MIHGTPQIFHNVRGIFIHIPKCAGTSIEKTLGGMEFGGHSYARSIRDKYPDEWERYYKFTIVRDPLTRFASGYNYLRQRGVHPALMNDNIHKSKDINDYIQNYFCSEDTLHLFPQVNFISDGEKILVDTYRYEELESSWKTILMKLNQHYKPLPCMNKSRDYTISYDKESLKILEEIYKKDFEWLGY
jgi:hypothetical protein